MILSDANIAGRQENEPAGERLDGMGLEEFLDKIGFVVAFEITVREVKDTLYLRGRKSKRVCEMPISGDEEPSFLLGELENIGILDSSLRRKLGNG